MTCFLKQWGLFRYFGRARDLPGVRELFEQAGKLKEIVYVQMYHSCRFDSA